MRVSAKSMGMSTDFRVLPLSNLPAPEVSEIVHLGEYDLFHTATLNGY